MVKDAKKAFGKVPLTEETVRFGKPSIVLPLKAALEASFRKSLITCKVKDNKHLGDRTADRETVYVDMAPQVSITFFYESIFSGLEYTYITCFKINLQSELKYEPGDHVGVMACNRKEIVDAVLERLKDIEPYDKLMQLQVMKETLTPTGKHFKL